MSSPTKNGVYYDLKSSPYTSERYGCEFHFSSMPHKEKFDKGVQIREEWMNDSFKRRFKIDIECSLLACFQWYIMCETRGFYVVNHEEGWLALDKNALVMNIDWM